MAETLDLNDELDMFPVLDVRVIDATKKNSHRSRRLTNFPVAETVQDLKNALKMFMPDLNEHVENWQIGYILDKNKKYIIQTDKDLQEACQHFKNGYQMWLDPLPKAGARKRQSDVNIEGKPKINSPCSVILS